MLSSFVIQYLVVFPPSRNTIFYHSYCHLLSYVLGSLCSSNENIYIFSFELHNLFQNWIFSMILHIKKVLPAWFVYTKFTKKQHQ